MYEPEDGGDPIEIVVSFRGSLAGITTPKKVGRILEKKGLGFNTKFYDKRHLEVSHRRVEEEINGTPGLLLKIYLMSESDYDSPEANAVRQTKWFCRMPEWRKDAVRLLTAWVGLKVNMHSIWLEVAVASLEPSHPTKAVLKQAVIELEMEIAERKYLKEQAAIAAEEEAEQERVRKLREESQDEDDEYLVGAEKTAAEASRRKRDAKAAKKKKKRDQMFAEEQELASKRAHDAMVKKATTDAESNQELRKSVLKMLMVKDAFRAALDALSDSDRVWKDTVDNHVLGRHQRGLEKGSHHDPLEIQHLREYIIKSYSSVMTIGIDPTCVLQANLHPDRQEHHGVKKKERVHTSVNRGCCSYANVDTDTVFKVFNFLLGRPN